MRALSRLIVVMLVLLWPHVCGGQTLSPSSKGRIDRPSAQPDATVLEIIRDLSRLPPRAARMRERILEAARSGS